MVKILPSALKHGVELKELAYALAHAVIDEWAEGRNGGEVHVFVGPRHAGALKKDYIEVFADTAEDGEAVIFHAMTAQDPWRV